MTIMEGHEARRHMVDDKKIKRRLRRTRRFRLTYTMRAGNLGSNKFDDDDDDGKREEKYERDKKTNPTVQICASLQKYRFDNVHY